jgi:hypothetical protein
MDKGKKVAVVILAVFLASAAYADLEWITGETPKNPVEKSNTTVVRDAPSGESHTLTTGNQDVLASILTTCTKMVSGYPGDSVNYFYLGKNEQVFYYAYFLIKPTSRIHTATVECFSPSNTRIAKYDQDFRVSFTDRLLTVQNDTYQWFMLTMDLGVDKVNSQFGQTALLHDLGLYTLRLSVDGQLVGVSFFYIKPAENKQIQPIATPSGAANPGSAPNALPMSTPISKSPISPVQKIK